MVASVTFYAAYVIRAARARPFVAAMVVMRRWRVLCSYAVMSYYERLVRWQIRGSARCYARYVMY